MLSQKVNKLLIISLFLFFKNSAFAQDTLRLSKNYFDLLFINIGANSNSGPYYVDDDTVDFETFKKLKHLRDSIFPIYKNAFGHYCIFYSDENKIIEEGRWYTEFFVGEYKNYYSDGRLMETGKYITDSIKIYNGKGGSKVGNWKYYTTFWELYLENNFDSNGNLISSKKHKVRKQRVKL